MSVRRDVIIQPAGLAWHGLFGKVRELATCTVLLSCFPDVSTWCGRSVSFLQNVDLIDSSIFSFFFSFFFC